MRFRRDRYSGSYGFGALVVQWLMPPDDADATEFHVYCPYCGEDIEMYLEPDVMGTLVMDCEVCCRPWKVHVTRDEDYRYVDVTRGDGSE